MCTGSAAQPTRHGGNDLDQCEAGQDDSEVVALLAAVDFSCAYPVEDGKPIFCRDPASCRCIELCVPRPDESPAERRHDK